MVSPAEAPVHLDRGFRLTLGYLGAGSLWMRGRPDEIRHVRQRAAAAFCGSSQTLSRGRRAGALAKEAGFDALAAGHHYLSPPYQSLQSLPLLAWLADEAPGMDLCLSVLLLAMLNPVQVAEDVASLDIMSEGRVVFGIGIGYRDVEYQAFGMTSRDRVPRMMEALDLINRLWSQQVVTFEGRFFRLHDATCTIRPVQKPHPPIWIAANADPAVRRTARLGYSWFINPHAPCPQSSGNGSATGRRWPKPGIRCLQPARSASNCTLRRATRSRSKLRGRFSKRNMLPTPNGARTRCYRVRKASGSPSTIWRSTVSSSAPPTRSSSRSRSGCDGWSPTILSSGWAGPAWRPPRSCASST
jgi:Luciferase-like monooxygenase